MIRLKKILPIAFCFLFVHTNAQTFQWAKAGNTIGANHIVFDRTGSLYTAGWQSITKYDSIGNFIWQQNIGGANYDIIIAGMAIDDSNNVYLAGGFGHTISIGSYTLTSDAGGNANTFLIKYNSIGIIQWVTRSHSNGDSGTDGITVDKQGNILIIGRFLDSLRLDSFVFDAPMTNQIFLAKYSTSGVCLWAKHLKSDTFDGGAIGPKIKSDGLGNSYICGHFNNYALFDSLQIFAHGGQYDQDVFLSKIDLYGNFLWLKPLGGNYEEIFYGSIDVDSVGNTHLSGKFESPTAYFDNYTLTNSYYYNYFTAKYDTDGNCKWAKYGNASVICAVNDGFYCTMPAFISKYDTSCTLQWTKNVSGANNYAMSASNEAIYTTGSYTGSVNFDTCTLSSITDQMYVAKLSNPNHPIITNIKETENTTVFSVFPNPASRVITINITTTWSKKNFTLKVNNSLGKNVYSETIKDILDSFTKQIDLNALPKGIYFIELQPTSPGTSQKKAEVKKIVLQ